MLAGRVEKLSRCIASMLEPSGSTVLQTIKRENDTMGNNTVASRPTGARRSTRWNGSATRFAFWRAYGWTPRPCAGPDTPWGPSRLSLKALLQGYHDLVKPRPRVRDRDTGTGVGKLRERRDRVRETLVRDLEGSCHGPRLPAIRCHGPGQPARRGTGSAMECGSARQADIEAKIAGHDASAVPRQTATPVSFATLAGSLGTNLQAVWTAPTTDARRKNALRGPSFTR